MIPYESILPLAFALAAFSYYLGLLIYSLPVPSTRVKRVGRVLVEDSLQAAALVFANSLLVKFVEWLALTLNIDPLYGLRVVGSTAAYLTTLSMLLKMASMGAAMLPIVKIFFVPFIAVAAQVVSMTIFVAMSLYMLLLVAVKLRYLLVALGTLLYALPFKVGRNVGATMIAFALVGYIAAGLYPQWAKLVNANMRGSQFLVSQPTMPMLVGVDGYVRGIGGSAPAYAVVRFLNITTGEPIATLPTDDRGYFKLSLLQGGLPAKKPMIVEVDDLGIKYARRIVIVRDAYPLYNSTYVNYRLWLVNSRILYGDGYYVATISNCAPMGAGRVGNYSFWRVLCAPLDPYQPVTVRIAFLNCIDNIYIDPSFPVAAVSRSPLRIYTWYGVQVDEATLTLYPARVVNSTNSSNVTLTPGRLPPVYALTFKPYTSKWCWLPPPLVPLAVSTGYATYVTYNKFVGDLLTWAVGVIVSTATYIAAVTTSVYAVARALGAQQPRLLVPV